MLEGARLRGCVVDATTGEAVVGATVVVHVAGGTVAELTDETGAYQIAGGDGDVTIDVYYGRALTTTVVQVPADAVHHRVPTLTVDTRDEDDEIIILLNDRPRCCMCVGDTKTGVTLTQDYVQKLPARKP